MNGLRLEILSGWWPIFWWFNVAIIAYWKQLLFSMFFGFIVTALFFIYSGESIYELPLFKLILWRWYSNKSTRSNTKLLSFIFVSNPSWYLLKKELKSSLIDSIVSFDTTHDFNIISFCMHYTCFICIYKRNKNYLHC